MAVGSTGDPHLLTRDRIGLAILGKDSLGLSRVSVGTSSWLSEAVAREPLSRGDLGEILLFLLLSSVQEDWEGTDTSMGTISGGERTVVTR